MKSDQSKRILILGAGAVGGYVGGCLAAAGHRVIFLCTPATGSEMRAHGLHVETPGAAHHVHPEAVEAPEEVFAAGEIDLAIVTLKRYDTEAVVRPFAVYAERIGCVLSLQNGIGAEAQLADLLGSDRIIPGTVTTAVSRRSRHSVVVERMRGVGVAGEKDAAGLWAAELDRAGLNCRVYPDAADMKWSKLFTNLIANPTSAILDLSPAQIFAHPGLFRLEILQLREALAVIEAIGAQVVDLPGMPVRLLAFCAAQLPLPVSRLLLGGALGRGRGGKMPSFHADLYGGGGRSEIGYYHGAVVRQAEVLGIDVPVNRLLTDTFTGILQGRLALADFLHQPDRLLAALPTAH